MPYASGETPAVGDYVKNKWEQPGTVLEVQLTPEGKTLISVRWDDGGSDLPLTVATEFTLISKPIQQK